MPSAAECRELSRKCQRIVREFHIVWRVVTLYYSNSSVLGNSVPYIILAHIKYHGVERYLHCCKGKTLTQQEITIVPVSELGKKICTT